MLSLIRCPYNLPMAFQQVANVETEAGTRPGPRPGQKGGARSAEGKGRGRPERGPVRPVTGGGERASEGGKSPVSVATHSRLGRTAEQSLQSWPERFFLFGCQFRIPIRIYQLRAGLWTVGQLISFLARSFCFPFCLAPNSRSPCFLPSRLQHHTSPSSQPPAPLHSLQFIFLSPRLACVFRRTSSLPGGRLGRERTGEEV